jgi:hypothetical protein
MKGKSTVTTDHEARTDRGVREGHRVVPFASEPVDSDKRGWPQRS